MQKNGAVERNSKGNSPQRHGDHGEKTVGCKFVERNLYPRKLSAFLCDLCASVVNLFLAAFEEVGS